MAHDVASMTEEEILAEIGLLNRAREGGRSASLFEDDERLRELNVGFTEKLGRGSIHDDRRQHLRLATSTKVVVRVGDVVGQATCCELSRGGLFIRIAPRLPVDSNVLVEAIDLDGDRCHLMVAGTVVWQKADIDNPTLPNGVGVKFVDVDENTQSRIDAAFDRLFERLARRPRVGMQFAHAPMLKDELQLGWVCQALLRRVGLETLWTPSGPSADGKSFLRENGRPLAADRRAMLLLVWALWTGTLDLRATQLWHLDGDVQESAVSLWLALRVSAKAVDEWLIMEASRSRASP